MKRNLIYLIAPLAKSDTVWQDNLRVLNIHQAAFNARRIVTIVQGDGMRTVDQVRPYLPDDCEIITGPNDTKRHESPHFMPMMRMIQSTDPNEITFFGHAKGVGRSRGRTKAMHDQVNKVVRHWYNRMYTHCLAADRVPDVEEALSSGDYDCTGCFTRREWRVTKVNTPLWHYSGTFFWFNHSGIFTRDDWEEKDDGKYGVEAYLGQKIPYERAHCLYGAHAFEGLSTYHIQRRWWLKMDAKFNEEQRKRKQ